MKRYLVRAIKKMDNFSALSVRLTKLTGKSKYPVHPKHLVKEPLWLKKYLKQNMVVLDLGSSNGQTAIKIAWGVKRVIGAEINEKLLKTSQESAKFQGIRNVEFVRMDANKKFPFKNNQFDLVLCADVLEHLDKRSFALSEIKRVLRTNGWFLLVTDNPDTSWKRVQRKMGLFCYADPEHRYEYSKEEIARVLTRRGFGIKNIETVTYDTPFKGLIDLVGGFSLEYYKHLRGWRQKMNKKYPEETTGFRIVTQKT